MARIHNDSAVPVLVAYCIDAVAYDADPTHTDHKGHRMKLLEVPPGAFLRYDDTQANAADIASQVATPLS